MAEFYAGWANKLRRKLVWLESHKKLRNNGFFDGDARRAAEEGWERALSEYRASLQVMNKYANRFMASKKSASVMTFFGTVIGATIVFEIVIVMLLTIVGNDTLGHTFAVMMFSLSLIIIASVLIRFLYYYWMDFQLILAYNRITAYESVWSGIKRIALETEGTSETIPAPPRKDVNNWRYHRGAFTSFYHKTR